MSALDFGGGAGANTTRSGGSASAALLPVAGFSVGVWLRHGVPSGTEVLIGAGVDQAANSLVMRSFSGVEYGVDVRDGVAANTTCRVTFPSAGTYLLVTQYAFADGSVRLYLIPKGATVSGSSDSTGVALANFTPTTGWYIGGDGTSFAKMPLGEAFVLNRVLTNAELTLLAGGAPVTAVEPNPQYYWPLRNGTVDVEKNRGVAAGGDLTLAGTGYTLAQDFFPASPFLLVPTPASSRLGRPGPISLYSAAGWFGKRAEARRWFSRFLIAPTPSAGTTITTTTGDAAANGIAAAIDQKRAISTSVGNAIGAGATAAIDQKRSVATATGNALADGTTAVINAARVIATTTGDATAAGATATINGARVIQTSAGNAVADGVTASLNQATTIATTVGNAVAAGATAAIDQARKVATVTGDATAAGTTARVDQARVILTSPGDAAADGVPAVINSSAPVTIVCTPGDAGADGVTALIVSTPLQPDGPFIATGRQLLNELEVEMLLDRERLEASDIDVLEILTNLFALEVFE